MKALQMFLFFFTFNSP